MADLLELKGDSVYRVAAYREAARSIENFPKDIRALDESGQLQEIPGVGPSIASKIHEYLQAGKIGYLDDLQRHVNTDILELLQVPGLGPRKAQYIAERIGVTSLDQLEQAAVEHRLSKLPGIGTKTEEKLLRELRRMRQRSRRLLLSVALTAAEEVVDMLQQCPATDMVVPTGSIRRRKETIGDIDILASSKEPAVVMDAFTQLPNIKEIIAKGATKTTVLNNDDLQIDLRVVDPSTFGAALQHFTGSKEHNIALRGFALYKGFTVNEYGIFDVSSGQRKGGQSEGDIYDILGMQFIPPELRENTVEIESALAGRLPVLLEEEDIKGDLHVHSDWSDGVVSIADMVDVAIDMGYSYVAICDHSKTLRIAHGLSVERVQEQQNLIRMLNCKYAPFVILSGIEVDILTDGELDYPDEILKTFDIVTASIHSGFSQSRAVMTARIIKAMHNPYVDVINHPTGRLLLKREPYEVDLERIIDEAAHTDTALEINASPDRLDLDDVWARRAKEQGVSLVVSTDSHGPEQMAQMRYGVFVARRGWVEKGNVLNTRARDALTERRRRKAA